MRKNISAPPAIPTTYTIGKLAAAAAVNVETVRYYERRGLLIQPPSTGGYRHYGAMHLERLAFIRRAQGMGFSLDEIAELMQLNDMTDHLQARNLAQEKITTISEKIAHLQQMQHALQQLVSACNHGGLAQPCPIIDMALAEALTPDKQSPATTCHPDSSH